MDATLRPVRDDDLDQIGELHFRSRADADRGFLSPAALAFGGPDGMARYWTERWKWERDNHRLTVADVAGRVAGFTYLGPSEEPGAMELNAIHVDPKRIGTGIGRELMIDAVAHLGPYGVLWVLDFNERARRFYERGGWRPDGTTRVAPMGGDETVQVRYALRRPQP